MTTYLLIYAALFVVAFLIVWAYQDWTTQCEITLILKGETADAVFVQNLHGKDVRLPKSMLSGFMDNQDGTCELDMSEWAALKLGLL